MTIAQALRVPFATLVTSLTLVSTSDAQIHIPNFGDLPNGTVAGFDGNSLATLEAHGVYSLPATGSTPFVNSFLPNNWYALPTGAAAAGIIGSFAKRANGNLLHADSLFGGAVREYGPSGVWTPLGPPIAGGAELPRSVGQSTRADSSDPFLPCGRSMMSPPPGYRSPASLVEG